MLHLELELIAITQCILHTVYNVTAVIVIEDIINVHLSVIVHFLTVFSVTLKLLQCTLQPVYEVSLL